MDIYYYLLFLNFKNFIMRLLELLNFTCEYIIIIKNHIVRQVSAAKPSLATGLDKGVHILEFLNNLNFGPCLVFNSTSLRATCRIFYWK